MKIQIDDNLITNIKSLTHNCDENSIEIVITDDLENDCFEENIRNWNIQALPHSNRIWTVYYYKGFKITE